jgi:hypothetical protein
MSTSRAAGRSARWCSRSLDSERRPRFIGRIETVSAGIQPSPGQRETVLRLSNDANVTVYALLEPDGGFSVVATPDGAMRRYRVEPNGAETLLETAAPTVGARRARQTLFAGWILMLLAAVLAALAAVFGGTGWINPIAIVLVVAGGAALAVGEVARYATEPDPSKGQSVRFPAGDGPWPVGTWVRLPRRWSSDG